MIFINKAGIGIRKIGGFLWIVRMECRDIEGNLFYWCGLEFMLFKNPNIRFELPFIRKMFKTDFKVSSMKIRL